MQFTESFEQQKLARVVGWSLLGSIIIGIASALFLVDGIDINLSADVVATAENMLEAELRLRAKAYIGLLSFALGILVSAGLYLLLRKSGQLLAHGACLSVLVHRFSACSERCLR